MKVLEKYEVKCSPAGLKRLGKFCRKIRELYGWSQADLAVEAQLTVATIKRFEAGDYKRSPFLRTAVWVFKALGAPLTIDASEVDW